MVAIINGRTGPLNLRRLNVVAGSGGDYTTLSDALAAITDAAEGNEYTVVVSGEIAETATVTAKSHVHVQGLAGATVTVTATGAGAALSVDDLTNSLWHGVRFVRAGAVTVSNVDVLLGAGTTDSTVVFTDCEFLSETTQGAAADHHTGINLTETFAARFVNCRIQGGVLQYGYGVLLNGTVDPTFENCWIRGGAGTNCHAVLPTYASKGLFINCYIAGAVGGSVSAAMGIAAYRATSTRFVHCTIRPAWDAGGNNNGVYCIASARPEFDNCVIYTGNTRAAEPAVRALNSSAPQFRSCRIGPPTITGEWLYDDANSGRFQLHATKAVQLVSLDVDILVNQAGKTLDIGVAASGDTVAADIDIGGGVNAYLTITLGAGALAVLAAGGYLYATPSAAVADGAFRIRWTAVVSYATSEAIRIDTTGKLRAENCVLIGAPPSNAIYIPDGGGNPGNWRVDNCHIEAMPKNTSNLAGVDSQSAIAAAPVYNSTIVGGVGTNVVVASSAANGSNREVGTSMSLTLLASAARTTDGTSSDQTVQGRGLQLFLNVSAIVDSPSITPTLQIKDAVSSNYKTIWAAGVAVTATGQYVYLLALGGAGGAGSYTEAVNVDWGGTWRLVVTHGDADSITYSVSGEVLE